MKQSFKQADIADAYQLPKFDTDGLWNQGIFPAVSIGECLLFVFFIGKSSSSSKEQRVSSTP